MRPLLFLGILFGLAYGQPKPPEKKDLPKLIVALPLAVSEGKETKLLLRGLRLDTVTEAKLSEAPGAVKIEATIVRKGKVAVPNMLKAEQVGDSEIEIKFTAPAGDKVHLEVTGPAGKSAPHAILLNGAIVVAEKEPNNSYATAQSLKLGQIVAGVVASNQDVDVFRFEGEMGQTIVAEVLAARLGSPLDAFLTLTDEAGQILAQSDDLPDSRDARIEFRLSRKGAYFLSLQDAHDLGSPAHVLQLHLRTK